LLIDSLLTPIVESTYLLLFGVIKNMLVHKSETETARKRL